MSRLRAVALAAMLVLVAGVGPAVPASGSDTAGPAAVPPTSPGTMPTQVMPPNTTAVLLLGPDERGAIYDPDVDLSSSLTTDRAVTEERLARERLRERYASAGATERSAVLASALDRMSERIAAVSAAEDRLQRRYANDTATPSTVSKGLATLDARARSMGRTVAFVENRLDDGSELRPRINDLERRLASVRGPVRDRVGAAIRGATNVSRAYLAGTADGVRLAMVADGVHYHESSRPVSERSSGDTASIAEAERRIAELYPWAWNNSQGTTVDVIGADTYRATIEHPHGSLVSYVDAASLQVVREIQRRNVSALPSGPGISRSQGGLGVIVNRTYPGGPLRIVASDGANPVDATVRVDDAVVGTTGADGTLWTVSPDGGPDSRFIVTAERGGTQVSLIAQPTQPSSGA